MQMSPLQPHADESPQPGEAAARTRRWAAAQGLADVFLSEAGLPRAWAGRERFVVLDTAFGLGHNFLALWDAWRRDRQGCGPLHVVAVEARPPLRETLAQAHGAGAGAETSLRPLVSELLAQWPPLTPNLHALSFDQGQVRLTLALGDPSALLRSLRLSADVIFIAAAPGAPPDPRLLKALGRLAAPGAIAVAAQRSPPWQQGLRSAGFEPVDGAGDEQLTLARWLPRPAARRLPATAVATRSAVVVGAGLAGAAVAQALAGLGLKVTVLEAESGPAMAASGNPAGLFHGTVNVDDGIYSRLFRAAALSAAAEYRSAMLSGRVAGQQGGLLRLAADAAQLPTLRDGLRRLGLPPEYVRLLDAAEASVVAGLPLSQACWHFPGGGWVSPPDWVRHALATPGVRLRKACKVQALERQGTHWSLRGADGQELERTALLVLANAADAARLLAPLGHLAWPLQSSRGQVSHWSGAGAATALRLPLAGDGYAIPLPDGLLCGATRQDGDPESGLRLSDHLDNIERLQRLCGLRPPAAQARWQGRVGWRIHTADRLPIAGALPAAVLEPGLRKDQARLLPREPGLFVLSALGSRGLTLAPLLARLVAAQATGTPWPVEQDLADAVDPARWMVRAARRAS